MTSHPICLLAITVLRCDEQCPLPEYAFVPTADQMARCAASGDVSEWIIEIANSKRYHVVERLGGEGIEALGLVLLEHSGLNPTNLC